ncbi:MAG: hypothetical protein R3B81_09240 [bacterium]
MPFTVSAWLVLVGVAVATSSHAGPLDPSLRHAFGLAASHLPRGDWTRLITSLPLTDGGFTFYQTAVMLALCVGICEWRYGPRKTMAVFFGVHLVVAAVTTFLLAYPLAHFGSERGALLVRATDVGPSAGYYGCLGFALFAGRPTIRPRAITVVLLLLALRFLWTFTRVPDHGAGIAADAAHLCAFPLGVLAARRWGQIVEAGSCRQGDASPCSASPPPRR